MVTVQVVATITYTTLDGVPVPLTQSSGLWAFSEAHPGLKMNEETINLRSFRAKTISRADDAAWDWRRSTEYEDALSKEFSRLGIDTVPDDCRFVRVLNVRKL